MDGLYITWSSITSEYPVSIAKMKTISKTVLKKQTNIIYPNILQNVTISDIPAFLIILLILY